MLEANGYQVRHTLIDDAAMTGESPYLQTTPPRFWGSGEVLVALTEGTLVQLATRGARERMWQTLDVLSVFRERRTLVLVRNLQRHVELIQWAKAITKVCVPNILGSAHEWQVVFDTVNNSQWRPYRGFDLVVIQDPEMLRDQATHTAVRSFTRPHPNRVAYGPPHGRIYPDEALQIEGTFGPLRTRLLRRPSVVQVVLPSHEGSSRSATSLDRAASQLWHSRNVIELLSV